MIECKDTIHDVGEYEIRCCCSEYEDYKRIEKFIFAKIKEINDEKRISQALAPNLLKIMGQNEGEYKAMIEEMLKEDDKGEPECKFKQGETQKNENGIKLSLADIAAINSRPQFNNLDLAWIIPFCVSLLNLGNNDGYFKGMCDAYEKIFIPNKQEENMQKAREAFAELKKSVENLTNGETK